jgi:hypothetical protein
MDLLSPSDAWAGLSLLQAAVVFAFYFVIDVLYAKYTYYVTGFQALKASSAGTGIYTLSALGVLSYSANWMYLVPLSLGSFLGTYVVVAHDRRKNESSQDSTQEHS